MDDNISVKSSQEGSIPPPPLTMEELMLESTLDDFQSSSNYHQPMSKTEQNTSHRSSYHQPVHNIPKNLSLDSNSFRSLNPDSFQTLPKRSFQDSPNTISFRSLAPRKCQSDSQFLPTSQQSLSFKQFIDSQRNSSLSRYLQSNSHESTREDLEVGSPGKSDIADYSTTVIRSEWDVTLPRDVLEESNNNDTPTSYDTSGVSPQRPISARSNATSVTLIGEEAESDRMRSKVISLRSDNARLRTLVSQLRDQLANHMNDENSSIKSSLSTNELQEEILCLKDQIKANEKTLRDAEDRVEFKDKIVYDKGLIINQLKNELVHSKSLLKEFNKRTNLAEKTKEKLSQDNAQLTKSLKEVQSFMSYKIDESQKRIEHDLAKVMRERQAMTEQSENLAVENNKLQEQLMFTNQQLQLFENKQRMKDKEESSAKEEVEVKISSLSLNLEEKQHTLKKYSKEVTSLREQREKLQCQVNELEDLNECQRDRLLSSQKENETAKTQIELLQAKIHQLKNENALDSIEQDSPLQKKILSDKTNNTGQGSSARVPILISPRKHTAAISELNMKLASKESHIKRLETRISNYAEEAEKLERIREELMVVVEKSRAGERRANELEDIVHLLEDEKNKFLRTINALEDNYHDKQAECESLEIRLKERTEVLSKQQLELEDRGRTHSELKETSNKHKSDFVQLNTDYTAKVKENEKLSLQVRDLELELKEKCEKLEKTTDWASEQNSQLQNELKKMKKFHKQQTSDLMEQVEQIQEERDQHKCQVANLRQQTTHLNDAVVATTTHVQQLEDELRRKQSEEMLKNQIHEQALKALEEKSQSSQLQVSSLEQALAQCKEELGVYVEQLHGSQSNFQHNLKLKHDQISKLETELKLIRSSLDDETKHVGDLEMALEDRHKIMDGASSRIADLEESQSSLQSQLSKAEQQQLRERTNFQNLLNGMQGKLKVACQELDAKNQQFSQLNQALKQVEEDFKECKVELSTVERHLLELRGENEEKSKNLDRAQFEWKEMKSKLDTKIEQVAKLEQELQSKERDFNRIREKNLSLETELSKIQSQAEDAFQHNNELQAYTQQRNQQILDKDAELRNMKEQISNLQSRDHRKDGEIRELESALEDRQRALQQRASQLNHLGTQLQKFQNDVGKKNEELECELCRTKTELKERNGQVGQLDEQLSSMRSDVREVKHLLEEQDIMNKRLGREIQQRDSRIEDLEKTIEAERRSREERHRVCIETSQELRLTRETEQNVAKQLKDSQREIMRLNREQQQYLNDLDDMEHNNREKDERLNKLTKQINQLASEKVKVESQYRDELERTQRDVQKIQQQCSDEIDSLMRTNAELLIKAKVATGDQEHEIVSALQRENECREQMKKSNGVIADVERELLARKQVIEAANETIVVKDAEIARLQAKLSGMERVVAMSSLPSSPVKVPPPPLTPKKVVTSHEMFHRPLAGNKIEIQKPFIPNNTTGSIFTGLDSDVESMAPSFVPIAASTNRIPEKPKQIDSSLFFLTSSPKHDDVTLMSNDEDSLFNRIFCDQSNIEAAPPNDYFGGAATATNGGRDSAFGFNAIFDDPSPRLKPERCMADLQEKLRASEQRRREVTSKLRNLKNNVT